jgi:hypothetical protein
VHIVQQRAQSCYFPIISTCNQVGVWRALNGKLKLKLPVLLLFFGAKRVLEEQNFFCSPHSSNVKQRNIVYAIWAVDSVVKLN